MEQKKLEAESKLVSKKFGAEQLGSSWFKALRQEFKKKYMDSVWYNFWLIDKVSPSHVP